jgi:hypothetical protein
VRLNINVHFSLALTFISLAAAVFMMTSIKADGYESTSYHTLVLLSDTSCPHTVPWTAQYNFPLTDPSSLFQLYGLGTAPCSVFRSRDVLINSMPAVLRFPSPCVAAQNVKLQANDTSPLSLPIVTSHYYNTIDTYCRL